MNNNNKKTVEQKIKFFCLAKTCNIFAFGVFTLKCEKKQLTYSILFYGNVDARTEIGIHSDDGIMNQCNGLQNQRVVHFKYSLYYSFITMW